MNDESYYQLGIGKPFEHILWKKWKNSLHQFINKWSKHVFKLLGGQRRKPVLYKLEEAEEIRT